MGRGGFPRTWPGDYLLGAVYSPQLENRPQTDTESRELNFAELVDMGEKGDYCCFYLWGALAGGGEGACGLDPVFRGYHPC